MHRVVNGDCIEYLHGYLPEDIACIFADPPDNIGLGYESYSDKLSELKYVEFLEELLWTCTEMADIVWISFNARWTLQMGRLASNLLASHERCLEFKPFVQTFTFGQNNKHDCGNGHRPLWRFKQKTAPLYPEHIKVPSWRELNGDKRAAPGGRVPLDVWDFPRVTGNSKQRRAWHPTQLHEGLVERAILLSTKEGDHVCDPFGGTGTTLRVCKRLNRPCTVIEIDPTYCEKIAEENECKIYSVRK
jgi:site-specific DNA-methyltransferase (adenine-specific)